MTFSLRSLSFSSFWPLSRRGKWIATIVIVVAAIAAYSMFGGGGAKESTFTVIKGDFEKQVAISGSVIAGQDANLGFAASGRVAAVYVKPGQRVGAGAVLAEIENGNEVAALQRSQAALAKAESDLASAKTGTRAEEVAIAQTAVANAEGALAEAVRGAYTAADDAVYNRADSIFDNPRADPTLTLSVPDVTLVNKLESERRALEPVLVAWSHSVDGVTPQSAKASATSAQANLAQVTTFLSDASKAVSKAVTDQQTSASTISSYATLIAAGRSSVDGAQSALVGSTNALSSAERDLALKQAGSTVEDITGEQALVASAQADVRSAQASLRKTRIIAPFAGVVTEMDVEAGEIVSPSTAGIAMQGNGAYQIETFIPEVAIADIAPGEHATTTLDAYSGDVEFPAVVVSVDPAETVKNGVPTYKTTLAFTAADPRIRSGMTAEVRIVTGVLKDTLVVPSGAVGRDAEGSFVMVQIDKKKFERRAVETGASPSLGQVEITSGLSAGDVIRLTP